MIKKTIILVAAALAALAAYADYRQAPSPLRTVWADEVTADKTPWDIYPRPLMERDRWLNLNGLWNYAITPKGAHRPAVTEGEIMVPYPVESALSGVGRTVGPDSVLWYERTFEIPAAWKDNDILLHFGAVDWKCSVWVNDVLVGSHTGGYAPFSFNITPALTRNRSNSLTVRVYDPTDKGYQPRGKQVTNPRSIWYTPVTGIWQTVWLEPVGREHLKSVVPVADIDAGTLTVNAPTEAQGGTLTRVEVRAGDRVVASGSSLGAEPVVIEMPEGFELWTPDHPFLYDLDITLWRDGKKLDQARSYAAMRKISTGRDSHGIMRMRLNNSDLFQFGPLDQGWWPDGLYTAPTPEAMAFDIEATKDLGFNMIRKHVKVEPEVWYAECDRQGILVWQDMPSGDRSPGWQTKNYFHGNEDLRSAESEANFRHEWREIMDALKGHPSIVVWVPFNESWGQFKTEEISDWTKQHDPTRLVNPASGGNFFHTGDILDIHNYPAPAMPLFDGERVNVLGEYGGIGLALDGHLWFPDRNWGYVEFKTPAEVTDEYVKYADILLDYVPAGFSAGVYTQTTDCEGEVNGLITYDRKQIKVDRDKVREANRRLVESLSADPRQ